MPAIVVANEIWAILVCIFRRPTVEQVLLLHDAYVYKLKIAAVILKRMQGISKFSRERSSTTHHPTTTVPGLHLEDIS